MWEERGVLCLWHHYKKVVTDMMSTFCFHPTVLFVLLQSRFCMSSIEAFHAVVSFSFFQGF